MFLLTVRYSISDNDLKSLFESSNATVTLKSSPVGRECTSIGTFTQLSGLFGDVWIHLSCVHADNGEMWCSCWECCDDMLESKAWFNIIRDREYYIEWHLSLLNRYSNTPSSLPLFVSHWSSIMMGDSIPRNPDPTGNNTVCNSAKMSRQQEPHAVGQMSYFAFLNCGENFQVNIIWLWTIWKRRYRKSICW